MNMKLRSLISRLFGMRTPPLMSERTCIFIKGLKLSSLNKEAIRDLKKLIAEIPEFCTLIVRP